MTNVRLPARVRRVVKTVEAGERLCKFLRKEETGETEVIFFFEPSGRRCGPASAQAAIKSGLLAPCDDGLLGADSSQTWTAA